MEGEGLLELRQQRIRKLEALRNKGIEPFALKYERSHTIDEALRLFATAESATASGARTNPVRVAGRVVRHRSQGKAGFADIVDGGGKIQLYGQVDHLGAPAMEHFNDLDLGDIVGAEGAIFRTRRGEISVELTALTLLTKALRPLPDKWHGLRDPELRFRQRHLDFIVNPDAARIQRTRTAVIHEIREFLNARDFVEVETPVLHHVAGGAAARPFVTHHNALDIDLYLRIAEELHLKRMIIGGFDRVYEVGRVFRNEGIDARHNPEFTILEAYQAYTDLGGMMELTEGMLRKVAGTPHEGGAVSYRGEYVDFGVDFARHEMRDIVRDRNRAVDVENVESLRRRAAQLGVVDPRRLDWGQALYEVFERSVQETIVQPTFVTGFPISISPLARRRDDDERLADRFELFIGGEEIANAFSELTDPLDQRTRFEQQLLARAAGDEETHPMDEDFISALEHGMPPTGGLGIGIDRLVMLFSGATNIREVIAFPLLRPPEHDATAEHKA